ncbi:MAG: TonB-dependent receptor, partial [Mangrovibacterium sp.]|nr:TonB-dependent receptor [Mangrovibacterium sp.]
TSNYNLGGTIVSGLSPSSSGNPDLGWETQVSKSLGIDLGAFNSRIQANLDYYINDTKDMLLEVPVPYISGYSSMLQNIGKVQNKGWEVEITSYQIKGKFNWSTTFNLSKNSNEVKKLGKDDSPMIKSLWKSNAFITKVGEAIGSYYMYKTDGVLLDADFDSEGNALVPVASGQEKGNIKIVDLHKDGKIDGNDQTIIGNNEPDFIWGLNNRLNFKGFDLNILIQGVQGGKLFFAGARQMDIGTAGTNQYSRWARCWKPLYSESENPLPATTVDLSWDGKTPNPNGNNPRYNDTWVYDATFIRIKNITVGYNLPKNLCKRFGIWNARIYMMGDNLFTWDNYPGVSTETNSYGDDVVTEPGVDYGTYPLTKKYSLGISVTF